MSWECIQKYEEDKCRIEEETLKSTEESLALLHETQECGISTASELYVQGRQLKKIDGQLDHLNNTLVTSQKNINGLTSMFGGLKSWFGNKKKAQDEISVKTILDDDKHIEKSNLEQNMTNYNNFSVQSDAQEVQNPPDFNSRFNNNMSEMSKSISMLKSLATDIGEEIDDQNILISDIARKTEEVDIKILQQNKEMKKILGK
ncbi:unnamed protein product [Ceutorhynchus assimilis]|uniref:t-SNARE coiled-coil homology domain-containing protein n=1 Tax=Ceutorhynchus assimilis TaxID=467358 RepID=A0A9N9QLW0_9CUCU|nr:unnamed protein product [Ceutorhynchus assimilis]